MSKDYHFAYTLKLNLEKEPHTSQRWSIQEWDSDHKLKGDFFPWNNDLEFTAIKIEYRHSFRKGDRWTPCQDSKNSFAEDELIRIQLRSGWYDEFPNNSPRYYILGNNNIIDDIVLFIRMVHKCIDEESIVAHCGINSERLEFIASVSYERFSKLRNQLLNENSDIVTLRLEGVQGVYASNVAALDYPDKIKILCKGNDLELDNTNEIIIPLIGNVDTFDLEITRNRKVHSPSPGVNNHNESTKNPIDQMGKNLNNTLRKVQLALWTIIALLSFSLLK